MSGAARRLGRALLAVAVMAGPSGSRAATGAGPGWLEALAAARIAARSGGYARARDLLVEADRRYPLTGPVLAELGSYHWKLGAKADAILAWQTAHALEPDGLAGALLRQVAPGLAVVKHLVRTGDEFVELARVLVDFRRQREVERALRELAVSKGLGTVSLPPGPLDASTAELVRAGFLERPGGPPSGRGEYRVAPDGTVASTVFGGPGALKTPPPALAHPAGFVVPPRVVREALGLGGPEVIEVGVHFLSARELEESATRLARAISVTRDPWAHDALLDRLDLAGKDKGFKVPRGLVSGLRHILAEGERRARWRAMGWLARAGEAGLPALPANELALLLEAAAYRRVPAESVAAALAGLGAGADAALAAVLQAASGRAFTVALEHAARAGAGQTAKVLIAGLGSHDEVWQAGAGAVRRALVAMAGGDQEGTPGGWTRWWVRRYGR